MKQRSDKYFMFRRNSVAKIYKRPEQFQVRITRSWAPPIPTIVPTGLIFAKCLVGIAIQPALAGLGGGDDRMAARPRVLARVFVRRAVATQGEAAFLTGAKVDPAAAALHAF